MSEYGNYDLPATPDDHGETPRPDELTEGDISTANFSMTAPVTDEGITDEGITGVDHVLGIPFWHPDAPQSPMTVPDGTETPDGYTDASLAGRDQRDNCDVLHTNIDGSPFTGGVKPVTAETAATTRSPDAATEAKGAAATDQPVEGVAPQAEARPVTSATELRAEPFYIEPGQRLYLPEQWRTSKEDLMGYGIELGYDETYQDMDRRKLTDMLKEILESIAAAEQNDLMLNVPRGQEAAAAAEAEVAAAAEAAAAEAAAAEAATAEAAKAEAATEAAAEAATAEAAEAEAAEVVAEAERILAETAAAAAEADLHMHDDLSAQDSSQQPEQEPKEQEPILESLEPAVSFASEPPAVLTDPEGGVEDAEVSDALSLGRRPDEIEQLRAFIEGDGASDALEGAEDTPGTTTRHPGSQYTQNPDGSFSVAGPIPEIADPYGGGSPEGGLSGGSTEVDTLGPTSGPDVPRESGFGDGSVEDGFAASRVVAKNVGAQSETRTGDMGDASGAVVPSGENRPDFDRTAATSTDLGVAASSAMEGQDAPQAAVGIPSDADPAFRGESDQTQSAALTSPGSSSPATTSTASAPAQGGSSQPDSDPTSGDQTPVQQTVQSSGPDSSPGANPASQPNASQQPAQPSQPDQDGSTSQPATSQQSGQGFQPTSSQQQASGDQSSSGQPFRVSASAAAAAANTSGQYASFSKRHPNGDTKTLRVVEGVGGLIAGLVKSPFRALAGLNMEISARPVETIFGKNGPLYEVVVRDRETGSTKLSTHRVLAPSAAMAKIMVQLTIPKRDLMG